MTRELRAVTVGRRRKDEATGEFHSRICAAYDRHSIREIARAADLSPSRILQILRKGGKS